jgi:hypothetical protein
MSVTATARLCTALHSIYNAARSHASLGGHTPLTFADGHTVARAELTIVRWVSHCRDLVQPRGGLTTNSRRAGEFYLCRVS